MNTPSRELADSMRVYTIVGGVDGVGKSSFLGVLKEVDPIVGVLAALDQIPACIDRRISFTQETTLSGRKTETTAKQVKDLGYHVRLFYIGLDTAAESLARIQNRVRRGGHDIPENDVERRFAGRWEAVSKVLPYCDEAEFYDNDNGFVKVAEYRNGELRTIGKHLPLWLRDLQEYLNK